MSKIDSHLEDRSKLVFQFPGVERPRTLNFMENIKLNESTQGTYSEYNPIGRNGSVFVYLGSKSRKFSLDFNLTLPNIMQFTRYPHKKDSYQYDTKANLRKEYFETVSKEIENRVTATQNPAGGAFLSNSQNAANDIDSFVTSFDLQYLSLLDEFELTETVRKIGLENAQGMIASTKGNIRNARTEAIAKIMMWVNLIRSSIMTNSSNPVTGPPIVRITHGILYQNVPCIVDNYGIAFDEEVTYDQRTLLPRQIKVSMDLREVRTSYSLFKSGDPIQQDGIPGWQSVLEDNATIDPVAFANTLSSRMSSDANSSEESRNFLTNW